MFDHWFRESWIALSLVLAAVAPASAEGPVAGFKLDRQATAFVSPDRTVQVEQYAKDTKDDRLVYQFWTFDRDHPDFAENNAKAVKTSGPASQ
jgi:hypothetical protein